MSLGHLLTAMQFNYDGKSQQGGIYCIFNVVSGRYYIGSCKEFKARWKQHAKALESGKHSNKFLLNDFKKTGTESLVFRVIEVLVGDKAARLAREQEWLNVCYDEQTNCYNLRPEAISREQCRNKQPRTTRTISPETRQRMSIAHKRLWDTSEHRAKMSASVSAWATERFQDPSERVKLSNSRKGKANPMFGKTGKQNVLSIPVQQICPKTGVALAEFDSVSIAKKLTGILGISNVLNGHRPQAGGFYWRRA